MSVYRSQLQQVLLNLTTNAIQAMLHDRPAGSSWPLRRAAHPMDVRRSRSASPTTARDSNTVIQAVRDTVEEAGLVD